MFYLFILFIFFYFILTFLLFILFYFIFTFLLFCLFYYHFVIYICSFIIIIIIIIIIIMMLCIYFNSYLFILFKYYLYIYNFFVCFILKKWKYFRTVVSWAKGLLEIVSLSLRDMGKDCGYPTFPRPNFGATPRRICCIKRKLWFPYCCQ